MIKALLLCAGLGTRLGDLTQNWPKCLMPISGRPLLEYWLQYLKDVGVDHILINTHYKSEKVEKFLNRNCFRNLVQSVYEKELLGTAGTLIHNSNYFKNNVVLMAHGDNWTNINLKPFIDFHLFHRNKKNLITMMIFDTSNPEHCGIIKTNNNGEVVAFYEKTKNPPGNQANAAVYILEPEVIDWLLLRPWIRDFSTEVIPAFIGKIETWKNKNIFRDIGTPEMLKLAQSDKAPKLKWDNNDEWAVSFLNNPIHYQIENI